MSENAVLIGVGSVFAVFILIFLGMRMVLRRSRGGGGEGSAGVAGDGGSGLESGHDWHVRQQSQMHGQDDHGHGHHHGGQDHGGSSDSGGGDGGGGGGGD